MRPAHWCAAIAAAGILVALLLPLSPALSPGDARQARAIGAIVTASVCAALSFARGGRPMLWTIASVVLGVAGLVVLFLHIGANAACAAPYDDRLVLIGREYTPYAADYVARNPGLSSRDLLLDAGGVADRIWTAASISSCRFWVGSGGLLAVPLFAAAVGALTVRREFRFAAVPRPAATPPSPTLPQPPIYDAFLSYRHAEPDRTHATEILAAVESRGLRVAVDFRDFEPNQHFLSEMERCIRQSRFVLCVVTGRYLDSDNCSEEAIISKTLDLADRRKRLVPLIFERVEVPVWLHGLVGIDFTDAAPVDPVARLVGLLTAAPAVRRP
jgi:hypothetical protein